MELLQHPAIVAAVEAKELENCHDFLHWRLNYAFTNDKGESRKRMPELPYNEYLWGLLDSEPPVLVFDKSRQMLISWEICAYLLWYGQFRGPVELLVASKVQRDTEYLLTRMRTIHAHQPFFIRRTLELYPTDQELVFSNGSRIKALPEGEEVLRGYQPRKVWFDECGQMVGLMARYQAALPMAEEIILSGTPNLHGDWWRIVKDIRDEEAA